MSLCKCINQVKFPSYQGYGYHCTTQKKMSYEPHILLHLSTVAPK